MRRALLNGTAGLLFFLVAIPASAQLQLRIAGVSATQAVFSYTAPDELACTIQVSESSTYSPLALDVDPAVFTGADSDTARNILPTGAQRLVRIGMRIAAQGSDGRWHSRALAADTRYYARVSCSGASDTATFSTSVPGSLAPEPIPTDPNAWGNLAFPEFDWSDLSKPVVEPKTGLKIYTADPSAHSQSTTVPLSANWFGGASGWTSAANISQYGTAFATTANQNPISAYVDPSQFNDGVTFYSGNWPYDNILDLGVDIFGSGTDAAAGNRTIQAALSIDSGQTPYTSWVSLALPQNTNAAAGIMPSVYPSAYFRGWGAIIPRAYWPKQGYVTATGGVVTLTKNVAGIAVHIYSIDSDAYFLNDWAPGTKLFIANSSPTCAGNFCTIASVQSNTKLTLVESLTLAENAYRSAGLTVMIRKTNTTGAVSLSARIKVAKGYPHDIWTGGCAANSVTTTVDAAGNPLGRTITGYPCIFPRVRQEVGALYFIGVSEPTIRLISVFRNPGTLAGHTVADSPSGGYSLLGPTQPVFDPADSTIMYMTAPTNGGSPGLFKITYTGDWRAYNTAYQSNNITPPVTTELTWLNLTKGADSRDMRTQILANTTFDEARYGALTSLQSVGLSGPYSVFSRSIGSQESACWIFSFNSRNGNFYRAWRTDDGSSLAGVKFAGCHAVVALDNSYLFLSSNGLRWSNTTMPFGGPFVAAVASVKQIGGTYNSNTSLPWPPDSTYDSTCPSDLASVYQANGAVGNQCVTVRTKQPCSSFGVVNENVWSPCAWDSTKSQVAAWAAGDWLKDSSDLDAESFYVTRVTDLGSGNVELVLQRNASLTYCAYGKDGVDSINQVRHLNGWKAQAMPLLSCSTAGFMIDMVGNAAYSVNPNLIGGHFDVMPGIDPGAVTFIGGSNEGFTVAFNRQLALLRNKRDYVMSPYPTFGGYDGGASTAVQSYSDAQQKSASPDLKRYIFNFRHYNGGTGIDLESPNQTLGTPPAATIQVGTTSVYKLTYTGTPDPKRNVTNVWAGNTVLSEKSSATTGNTLTDSDTWKFCYAKSGGECRSGSAAGDLYAVIPRADIQSYCWASQINTRTPCVFAGPVVAMNAMQLRSDKSDPSAVYQRLLGTLLMGPGQQYVYSKILPTPDASYILFGGYLTHGYHTALMAAKLPPFPNDSVAKNTYAPVIVKGVSASAYVEFGYEEFGNRSSFFCTSRQEACRVASASINESNPFSYASESLTNATGTYAIAIPAIHGRILYYHVVDGGNSGPLQVAVP